jgi:hypothetical protein
MNQLNADKISPEAARKAAFDIVNKKMDYH